MSLVSRYQDQIDFSNSFIIGDLELKEAENEKNTEENLCVKIEVDAPIYAWNYFHNNSIDEDDFIYEEDLDISSFKLEGDGKSIYIELTGNNKIQQLQDLLSKLFNEKHREYSEEYGYSGFKFKESSFFFKSDNRKYEITINDYKVKLFELV
jgi:hypothetical protein